MAQDVDDTFKQMAGSNDAFENREQAFRFGYTAQHRYQSEYPSWNHELEKRLCNQHDADYDADHR